MNFAQISKELREELGLSQQKLADKLGLSSSGIAHLELGQREPGSATLLAYAKYFGVTTDYLLGLENDYGAKIDAPTPEHAGAGALTREETKLIEQYRSIPEQLRKIIREQLEIYSSTEELLPKQNKKV